MNEQRVITFGWKDKIYEVGMGAYDNGGPIKLPDGTYLQANQWMESFPPQPGGLHEVTFLFDPENTNHAKLIGARG